MFMLVVRDQMIRIRGLEAVADLPESQEPPRHEHDCDQPLEVGADLAGDGQIARDDHRRCQHERDGMAGTPEKSDACSASEAPLPGDNG